MLDIFLRPQYVSIMHLGAFLVMTCYFSWYYSYLLVTLVICRAWCAAVYTESGADEMPSGHLIADMETVKDALWKKLGIILLHFMSN